MKVLPNSVTAAIVVFMGLWPRASGQRTDDTIDVELTDDVIDVGLTDDALDVNGGVSILSSCTVPGIPYLPCLNLSCTYQVLRSIMVALHVLTLKSLFTCTSLVPRYLET